jgi:hypothetical protein
MCSNDHAAEFINTILTVLRSSPSEALKQDIYKLLKASEVRRSSSDRNGKILKLISVYSKDPRKVHAKPSKDKCVLAQATKATKATHTAGRMAIHSMQAGVAILGHRAGIFLFYNILHNTRKIHCFWQTRLRLDYILTRY